MSTGGITRSEGPNIPFGPDGQMHLPAKFTSEVRYGDTELEATMSFTFDGQDVDLIELTIKPFSGGLRARDITRLELQEAVHRAIEHEIQGRGGAVSRATEDQLAAGPTPETLRMVAHLYWIHHVSWGSPRAAVMNYFQVSRTTANTWIRKAAQLYPMPGPHAKDKK